MTTTIDETTGEILSETGEPTPEPEPEHTPDEDDEHDDEEPETVPEPDPALSAPVDESAELFGKAAKRAKTYLSAVPEILGEHAAELSYCPRCADFLPGFILPMTIKPVPDEQKAAVKMSIGELVEVAFKQADDAATCPKCDGLGKVATGSQVHNEKTGKCLECKGRGWIGARLNRVEALAPEEKAALLEPVADAPEEKPVQDPWGRFIDDPLYGVMPGFERD